MTNIWHGKDRDYDVRAMSDDHIRNVLAYFRKRAEAFRLRQLRYYSTEPNGDAAYDCWERELAYLIEADEDEVLCMTVDGYKHVLAEAERRELT